MPTDRSNTERIRRLKAKLQAERRIACPGCPEQGPRGGTDASTRLSRSFGDMKYLSENADGAAVESSCCVPEMFLNILIDDLGPNLRLNYSAYAPRNFRNIGIKDLKLEKRAKVAKPRTASVNDANRMRAHGMQIDASGNVVLDASGRPMRILDASGNPVRSNGMQLDASGNVVLDASGRPVRIRNAQSRNLSKRTSDRPVRTRGVQLDASGNPVLDASGNPIRIHRMQLDASGNPVLDASGNPVRSRGVQLDASGRPVHIKDSRGRSLGARARDISGNSKSLGARARDISGNSKSLGPRARDISGNSKSLGPRGRGTSDDDDKSRGARARDASGSIIAVRTTESKATTKKTVAAPRFSPRLNAPENTLVLPIIFGSNSRVTVNWGDDTIETYTSSPVSHTYAASGSYNVKISGSAIGFGNGHSAYTGAEYIRSVSQWDALGVTSFSGAFNGATNLESVPASLPSTVTDTSYMFYGASSFNGGEVSGWDTSSVTDMAFMFNGATAFNQNLSRWNVSNVTNVSGIFTYCALCPDLSDVPAFPSEARGVDTLGCVNETDMVMELWVNSGDIVALPFGYNDSIRINWGDGYSNYYYDESLSTMYGITGYVQITISRDGGDIDRIGNDEETPFTSVVNVTQWGDFNISSMQYAFYGAVNLASVPNVLPPNVTNTRGMFFGATSFNGDISAWDVSGVDVMDSMFSLTNFNGDISAWDTTAVTEMQAMFAYSSFDQDISDWNTSNVTNMSYMFSNSNFNGDISEWDTSSVTDMDHMFFNSPFDQNISSWDVSNNVAYANYIFESSPMCRLANYTKRPVFAEGTDGIPGLTCNNPFRYAPSSQFGKYGYGRGVAYGKDASGNGLWVSVGEDNSNSNIDKDTILYSSDPNNGWAVSPGELFGEYGTGYGITYGKDTDGNGLWVAVGYDDDDGYRQILYSRNPADGWTVSPTSATAPFDSYGTGHGIATDGNGLWVAVGYDDDNGERQILWSTDPTAGGWTSSGPEPFGAYGTGYGVAYGKGTDGNGLWIAVGDDNQYGTRQILWSRDPREGWTLSPGKLFDHNGQGYGIATDGNGLWVAVGDDNEDGTRQILYSRNPITGWTLSPGAPIFGYDSECNGIAYGNGLWIAVADDDETGKRQIVYSKDPSKGWTVTPGAPLDYDGRALGIAYGNGLWVVVGYDTQEGIRTMLYTSDPTAEFNGFVGSPNRPFNYNGEGNGVAYANGLWVAVGDDNDNGDYQIWYSKNPASGWVRSSYQPFGSNGTGYGIATDGNGLWVAVGEEGNNEDGDYQIVWSTDPTKGWSRSSYQPFGYGGHGHGVAYANGLWVAVGYHNNGEDQILWSRDPRVGWTSSESEPFNQGGTGYGIAYGKDTDGNDLWVAVGYDQDYGEDQILWSRDPTDGWSRSEYEPFDSYGTGRGIATDGNGLWVAVGDDNNDQILWSRDPTGGWNLSSYQPFGSSGTGYGIAYNNGLWVATGYDDDNGDRQILYSMDPTRGEWSSPGYRQFGGYGNGNAVAYGNGLWVVVGYDDDDGINTIQYAKDPTSISTWSVLPRTASGITGNVNGIATNGNGLWVAVGYDDYMGINQIVYSTDLNAKWTVSPGSPPFNYDGTGNGVAYGDGLWVAVGYDDDNGENQIVWSRNPADGWASSEDEPFNYNGTGNAVAYGNDSSGNGLWVAVGYDDDNGDLQILYSTDPTDGWNYAGSRPFGGYGTGYGIATNGNGLWVAVGRDDNTGVLQILYSTDPTDGWTSAGAQPFGNYGTGYAVAYGNGLWVAVGYDNGEERGTILYSTDPTSGWNTSHVSTNSYNAIRAVVYTGNSWVAYDDIGRLYISVNPVEGNWEERSSIVDTNSDNICGLASANGVTVVVGVSENYDIGYGSIAASVSL